MFKSGVVVDFEKLLYDSVYIYTIGDISNVDDDHEKLDKYRKILRGISLSYDSIKKTWCIYE